MIFKGDVPSDFWMNITNITMILWRFYGNVVGFHSDLIGFNGDFLGFNCEFMGFHDGFIGCLMASWNGIH